jgi:hypothetical protein
MDPSDLTVTTIRYLYATSGLPRNEGEPRPTVRPGTAMQRVPRVA